MRLFSVLGNSQKLDGGAMFGNAPKAMWEKWYPADDQNRIHLFCRSLLIEAEGKNVLLEAGIGSFFEPNLKTRFGIQEDDHRLLTNLNKLQLKPDDIDYVILSHLHFDHAGGILSSYNSKEPELVFNKAKFVVGEEAYLRAQKPHYRDRASFIEYLPKLLEDSQRLIIISKSSNTLKELPFCEFIYTDGHTPGQMHTLVHFKNHKIFFAGDLIPGVAWLHLPITMGYDRFPEKIIDEKKILLERAVQENWLIYFTHDYKTAACYVKKDDKGRYVAADLIDGSKAAFEFLQF